MLWGAFMLGLIGSMHCAGMCGPIALAISFGRKNNASFFFNALLYNGGRIISYALLGGIVGGLGLAISLAGFEGIFSITVGIILLLSASSFLPFIRIRLYSGGNPLYQFVKGKLSVFLNSDERVDLMLIGLMNGFLPCGMVYTALAAAAVSERSTSGILFMILFGLGTFPMMMAISLSKRSIPLKIRRKVTKFFPYITVFIAVLLILRGMNLNIPIISPKITSDKVSCTVCKNE